jgi:hypothetical protein
VYFEGDADELKGKLVQVQIIEALPYALVGEVSNRFAGGRFVNDGAEVIDAV